MSRQIQELLHLGFIEPSQVLPLVCVLKPKNSNGKQAIHILHMSKNSRCNQSVSVMKLQKVGNAKYISKCDANSGYHQCSVRKEDRWHLCVTAECFSIAELLLF